MRAHSQQMPQLFGRKRLFRRLTTLKIGQRLALGYGVVILMLVAVAITAVLRLKTLSETTAEALQDKYPKTILVNQLTRELGVIALAMRNALILGEEAQLEQQLREIAQANSRMSEDLRRLRASITDASGLELLEQIRIVHSAYIVNQEDFIKLVGLQRMGEARNLLVVDLHGYQNSYFELLGRLNTHQGAQMLAASHEVERAYANSRSLVFAFASLALLLSVLVTILITRSLLLRLGGEPEYAADIAHRIAAGDLATGVKVHARDHGSLLYAMNQMRAKLIERDAAVTRVNAELVQAIEVLNQAQRDLVSSEKLAALGALVAGVAHELNTPIGNSLLAASTIVDGTKDFEQRAQQSLTRHALKSYLQEMDGAGDILLRNLGRAAELISSFKQVAVDRQSSQRRSFALADVVNEIVLTLRPTLRKTPYVLTQEVPAQLCMDSFPGPLGQVITNLINNAILHGFAGREHGTVRIVARPLDASHVELSVQDDGVGIAPEHLGRVFEPFFTTRLGNGGSGLGLHIAFNIVTGMLGGKIQVLSPAEGGTTVLMQLPLRAPES